MRAVFILFLLKTSCLFAQLVVDIQKEFCTIDSVEVTANIVNHTSDTLPQIELLQSFFAVEILTPVLNDFEFSWTFWEGGLFKIESKDPIKVLRDNVNKDGLFTLDSGCTYSLNILTEQEDSLDYWYVGKHFFLPVYFDLGTSNLRADAQVILDDLVQTMIKYPRISIEIGVHFDERCSPELSTCLSCSQSEAMMEYLLANGINSRRVSAKGYQGMQPKYRNARTEEEHQKNRRVEITVTSVTFEDKG